MSSVSANLAIRRERRTTLNRQMLGSGHFFRPTIGEKQHSILALFRSQQRT